jgi:aspartate/methionine/tyrosine aminotransferase
MLQEQAPPPAGGLARPSERPEETISTGMGQPDLATPPAGRNRAAEALEQIFAVTGDARFEELANRARSI